LFSSSLFLFFQKYHNIINAKMANLGASGSGVCAIDLNFLSVMVLILQYLFW